MKSYQRLLLANKNWAHDQAESDPLFFQKMAEGQNPEFLWIGCADSRAPADKITGTDPGQIFVHRNVANLVVHTDLNMLSVLQYAVEVLKVKHVMVVGHYGCGGVKAAMGHSNLGLIDNWVRNIKEVYHKYAETLDNIIDENERFDRLCEFNVIEQAKNLVKTTIIQKAWADGNGPYIHGLILDLKSGLIKQIKEIEPGGVDAVDAIYRYKF